MILNIALLQMAACGNDQAANLEKGEQFCRKAARLGSDVALFPEMWNIGYQFPDGSQPDALDRLAAQAVMPDSPFVSHFKALARELHLAIAITYLEQWPGRPRNSVSLIDRRGEIVLHYSKVHTCEFDVERLLTPGEDFPTATLETAQGEVKIGAMICYDREFPECARILMLNGAEIILTPNACGLEINRLSQYRARAYENMMGMAMANYAAPDQNGHSVAYDGRAFSDAPNGEDGESRDMTLVEADGAEGVYLAAFDVAALRHYRSREGWGNAYRRPRLYHKLIDEQVAPPFMRNDATH
jgi:N-carbamoylputrescine amidase